MAVPVPPQECTLSETVRRLCGLSDAELATRDIGELNLLVARGLPGAEDLDIGVCLEKLDAWAKLVRLNTDHWWPNFARSPEKYEHTPGQFRMMCLVTVLQRYLGVRYNLAFSEGAYDGTDSRNLFIHGLLSGHGGTCVTMPILYIAIGRRLGYPLKLAHAKEHSFVRWEDPGGERFNIEATSEGFCPHDDGYYYNCPKPLTDADLATGFFLRSLTPREELADFLGSRGTCLTEHLNTYPAMEALRLASLLSPQCAAHLGQWATATMLWRMIEHSSRAHACTHAEVVAVLRLKAYRNELDYDTLPFPQHPIGNAERWALAGAPGYLRRVLENYVRKWRQGIVPPITLADGEKRAVAVGRPSPSSPRSNGRSGWQRPLAPDHLS
ncbi:MAG: transglutaminase family protein [Pirellulales bacterium]